jgi:hypothetical protein
MEGYHQDLGVLLPFRPVSRVLRVVARWACLTGILFIFQVNKGSPVERFQVYGVIALAIHRIICVLAAVCSGDLSRSSGIVHDNGEARRQNPGKTGAWPHLYPASPRRSGIQAMLGLWGIGASERRVPFRDSGDRSAVTRCFDLTDRGTISGSDGPLACTQSST